MKHVLFLLFSALSITVFSQPNTEVFLFDLDTSNGKFKIANFKNISNNEGYDNQPSFLDNNTILYAGTRNGQTDIVKYTIRYDSKIYVNHTEGSEYSPLKIPGQKAASSIRLEKNGDQKLYKYSLRNGESEMLIDDIIIGYHTWFNEHVLVSSVLENNKLALYTTFLNKNKSHKYHTNIGRSLHRIPNSELVSFINKSNDSLWTISSVDPFTGKIKSIVGTLPKSEDMCWLPNGTILMGHKNALYTFTPNKDLDWKEVISLEKYDIKNITRVAVSPDGRKLAIVGEGGKIPEQDKNTSSDSKSSDTKSSSSLESEKIVQSMMQAYNNRDIDAYMSFYDEGIKLFNYPNELTTDGAQAMKETYSEFFKNTPDLKAEIKNRIVHGNKVIDEAHVTINGNLVKAIAIYEIENNKIIRVTFMY